MKRDFVTYYKQTILGPFWFFLQPMFTSGVFTLIFSRIAKIPTDGVPPLLFYLSGTIIWNYFASCLTNTSTTFSANSAIFGKVYFPRLCVPISIVLTNLLSFMIQFLLFILIYLYYYLHGASIHPGIYLLLTPVLLLQMAILGMGCGILISALTTKYRDLTFVLGFGIQLWMYATPIVYPLSQVPEAWKSLYLLNPMAAVIETFRYGFIGAGSLDLWQSCLSFGLSVTILAVGILLFNRVEKTFMDTI
ncbi:ABC transporter permease [Anaeroselena agilis]|uniref:ABC transporter permease n=1 Tax=Anaeroselena agilis TaxID=3063788 RepID=UPI0039B6E9B7